VAYHAHTTTEFTSVNPKSVFQYSAGWSNRTKEPQSLAPYLDILVDEMLELSSVGVQIDMKL